MKIGDPVMVLMNQNLRSATFVCSQGADVVVAIQKGEKCEHHRIAARDLLRYEKCNEEMSKEFLENNFENLLQETQEALDLLLPGEKVEKVYGEHSIISATWGVRISATLVQIRAIGRVHEKPGWSVSCDHINFGRNGDDDFYDVVEVGDFMQNSLAAEAFIRCLFERKLENYYENQAF